MTDTDSNIKMREHYSHWLHGAHQGSTHDDRTRKSGTDEANPTRLPTHFLPRPNGLMLFVGHTIGLIVLAKLHPSRVCQMCASSAKLTEIRPCSVGEASFASC